MRTIEESLALVSAVSHLALPSIRFERESRWLTGESVFVTTITAHLPPGLSEQRASVSYTVTELEMEFASVADVRAIVERRQSKAMADLVAGIAEVFKRAVK